MSVTVKTPYRFLTVESERDWGMTTEYVYFETLEQATERYNALLPKPGPVPEYYYISRGGIETLNENGEWK